MSRYGILLAMIMLAPIAAGAQQPSPELLKWGVVGASCQTNAKPCYSDVMRTAGVQRELLELADGPRAVAEVDQTLSGDIKARDLLNLGLIRREGDRYFLNFPLFTAADVRVIMQTSERFAQSLAQALLARRADIGSTLRSYDAAGVDQKEVLFFVLGCASLDWDGLRLTRARGYRTEGAARPDGDYVPYAEEKSNVSFARMYRGSHNGAPIANVHFTSFGDDEAKRYAFPDLLWRLPAQVSAADYPESLQRPLRSMVARSLDHAGLEVGQILFALRDGDQTTEELARAAGTDVPETTTLLNLLLSLDYVSEKSGRYRARVPVLTKRDEAMTRRLVAIGHEVMENWLAANYSKIKDELKGLSFTRSGVPFEDGFTMIWHYLFGITNRRLVDAGLFADPYSPARKYKGSIPAVYEFDL